MTPDPQVQAAAKHLFQASMIAGYPGYRPNSQTKRFKRRYHGELDGLRDVSTPMPSVPKRNDEQPSFIALVKEELRTELQKLRKKERNRTLPSALSPVKRRWKLT